MRSRETFRPIASETSSTRVTRGHGASSPAPERRAYEYRDLVDDLAAVLDHLDTSEAALGGASMGAHTTMAYALAFPERVRVLAIGTLLWPSP